MSERLTDEQLRAVAQQFTDHSIEAAAVNEAIALRARVAQLEKDCDAYKADAEALAVLLRKCIINGRLDDHWPTPRPDQSLFGCKGRAPMSEPATKDFYYGWLFGTLLTAGLIIFGLVATIGIHWLDAHVG